VLQLYHPVIDAYNAAHGLTRATGGAAGVFFTHPGEHITPIHAFWDEVILTGLLLLGIFAITDEFNDVAPRANSSALMIGLLVATIGASAGYLEAWALNPARDFGPRLLAWLAGYDQAAFPSPEITGGSRLPRRYLVERSALVSIKLPSSHIYLREASQVRRAIRTCLSSKPLKKSPESRLMPQPVHILAIDQGTTSTRAIVFDRHARPVASAQCEFEQHYPDLGWVEHDPEDIWRDTLRLAKEAIEKSGWVPAALPASASPTSARQWSFGSAVLGR
jgi:hypothetical protein